jgi:hypothetical protein
MLECFKEYIVLLSECFMFEHEVIVFVGICHLPTLIYYYWTNRLKWIFNFKFDSIYGNNSLINRLY